MQLYGVALLALLIAATGCAVRQPQTYRLIQQANKSILIPPRIATADVPRRSFTADVRPGRGSCPPEHGPVEIRTRGKRLGVTVHRDLLNNQRPGWLREWAANAEAQGCVAPGEGLGLATRVIESLPLDPAITYRLLHANSLQAGYVDLGPENRLQVNSPIMREGEKPEAGAIESIQEPAGGRSLNVDLRGGYEPVGVETAWYAIQRKPNAIGFTIAPISAERSLNGKKESAAAPTSNYFEFAPQAAYYRLFYKTDRGTTRILIAGAATRAGLDQATQSIDADPGACEKLAAGTCILLPQHVAANPYVIVTVNQRELPLPVGALVRTAIVAGGERPPERVLPQLTVRRLYGGKLAAIEFDRTRADILGVILHGGEEISWD